MLKIFENFCPFEAPDNFLSSAEGRELILFGLFEAP